MTVLCGMQDESQVSSAVKESSDTSDDLSDVALESESGGVSLPNGIPASSVDRNNDVSSLIFLFLQSVWYVYFRLGDVDSEVY